MPPVSSHRPRASCSALPSLLPLLPGLHVGVGAEFVQSSVRLGVRQAWTHDAHVPQHGVYHSI